MSTIARRCTIFAGRDADATETTVLTGNGLVHSDAAQLTTQSGVAGWQPYLGDVAITRGELDPLSGRVTVGQATVKLLDVRDPVGGTNNLQRWVTGLLGNDLGRNQLLGCKVYLEIDLGDGNGFVPDFVGRIDTTELTDPLWYQLTILDLCQDLDVDCFLARPSPDATNVILQTLIPVGLPSQYAQMAVQGALNGTVGPCTNTNLTSARTITVTGPDQTNLANLITQALVQSGTVKDLGYGGSILFAADGFGAQWYAAHSLRLRLVSGVSGAPKELSIVQVIPVQRSDGHYAVAAVVCTALTNPDGSAATGDPLYTAFDTGTIADTTAVTFQIVMGPQPSAIIATMGLPSPFVQSAGPSGIGGAIAPSGFAALTTYIPPATPVAIYITDTPVLTVLADLLNGYYSDLWQNGEPLPPVSSGSPPAIGDPKFPIPFVTGSGTWYNLVNAVNRDPLPASSRWAISQSSKRFDFIEKQFTQVFGIGYRFKPALDGASQPQSFFEVCDLRIPISAAAIAGIPTIQDADTQGLAQPTWSQGRQNAVSDLSVTTYLDSVFTVEAASKLNTPIPALPSSLVMSVPAIENFFSIGDTRSIAIGSRPFAVDALGVRYTINPTDKTLNSAVHAQAFTDAMSDLIAERYKSMFGAGAAFVEYTTRHTATLRAQWPGDWIWMAASTPPSAGINKRGDTRLMMIVHREESGPTMKWKAIDAGAGAVCNTPTIGTPSQMTGNTKHGVTVTLTANAQVDAMQLWFLVDVTKSLSSPPADTDVRWLLSKRVAGSGTYSIQNLPSNCRIFVKARSVPGQGASTTTTDLRLPSAFVTPSGTKYVDLGSLSDVTGLAVSPGTILTNSTVVASWTVPAGSTAFPLNVYLDGTLVATLTANTPQVTLNPYIALSSHTYTLKVTLIDGLTGESSGATTTFTTPASFGGPTLTAPTLTLG